MSAPAASRRRRLSNGNEAAGRRSDKPSYQQREVLVDFLEEHRQLAAGSHLRAPDARRKSLQLWDRIAVRLNVLGGSVRNGQEWKKYWTDKKSYLKRQGSMRRQSARQTGGGVDAVPPLSALDLRMLALLGTSFGRGDGTEVDPFPPSQDAVEIQDAVELQDAVEVQEPAVPFARASTSTRRLQFEVTEEIGLTLEEETQLTQEVMLVALPSPARGGPSPMLQELPDVQTPPLGFADEHATPHRIVQQSPENAPRHRNERAQPQRRRQPMSALRREREWVQGIEQQRLALEQERLILERQRAERQERFQEQLLEKIDAMFTRLANALLARHEH